MSKNNITFLYFPGKHVLLNYSKLVQDLIENTNYLFPGLLDAPVHKTHSHFFVSNFRKNNDDLMNVF
jgi:hypothetical protein